MKNNKYTKTQTNTKYKNTRIIPKIQKHKLIQNTKNKIHRIQKYKKDTKNTKTQTNTKIESIMPKYKNKNTKHSKSQE